MGKHTPGPWRWFGNGQSYIYLATTHSGRRIVMDFIRKGFNNAQPRFQPPGGLMVKADELLQFEVGDQAIVGMDAAKNDTSVYRFDIRGIDNADARLIAAAPDLFEACKAAMRILALWGPKDVPVDSEHYEENKALAMMQNAFELAIAKVEQDNV